MPKLKAFNRRAAYPWYLTTAIWRAKREHVLKHANYLCEVCRERPATEVHHVTYIRVFNELPTDLMAICRKCHAEIHDRRAANDNQLSFKFP